jgi:hypothetical protein
LLKSIHNTYSIQQIDSWIILASYLITSNKNLKLFHRISCTLWDESPRRHLNLNVFLHINCKGRFHQGKKCHKLEIKLIGMTFLVFSVEKKSKATNTNEKQSNQRCLNVIYMYILVCLWFIYSLFMGKILVNIKGILYTLKAV